MKVANVIYAVNTPLRVDGEIRLGKTKVRYSDGITVINSGGYFAGYTNLEETKDSTVDRVVVGEASFIIYDDYDSKYAKDALYCLCVGDELNDWIAVMPRRWEPPEYKVSTAHETDKEGALRGHVPLKELTILVMCILLLIFIVVFLIKLKSTNHITWIPGTTETTTQTLKGGDSVTYEYGANVSTNETIEDSFNSWIEADRKTAEKERANTPNKDNAIENSSESDISTGDDAIADKPSVDEIKDKTINPAVSSIKETVLVPKYESVADDVEGTIAESSVNGIGDITLADGIDSFTLNNITDFTISFEMKCGDSVIKSAEVAPGTSQEIYLRDVITESTKVIVSFKYTSKEGALYSKFSTDIWVNIL